MIWTRTMGYDSSLSIFYEKNTFHGMEECVILVIAMCQSICCYQTSGLTAILKL